MNEASRWRWELAQVIGPAYAAQPDVRVVEVGGSVSRGCADRYSDIEIGVFWDAPPAEEARQEAAHSVGGAAWRAHEFADGEWSEEYTVAGVKIDVSHRLVGSAEEWLAAVLDRCDTDVVKQNLISALRHALPLHGVPLLCEWQSRAGAYPDGLAEAMVRENLMLGPHQWLEMLASRDSLIELYAIVCQAQKRLLGVLLGLNRVYHPGFKWMGRLAAELPLAPPDLGPRLVRVFREEPGAGVGELQLLIDETYGLVDAHLPAVDTGAARARLAQRRATWDHAPR